LCTHHEINGLRTIVKAFATFFASGFATCDPPLFLIRSAAAFSLADRRVGLVDGCNHACPVDTQEHQIW